MKHLSFGGIICCLLISVTVGTSGRAFGQNAESPETVLDFVRGIDLGVQANGGVREVRRTLNPIQGTKFLGNPVRENFSYTRPYYGIGLALRGYGVKVSTRLRTGEGVQSTHWVKFDDGGQALPFEPQYVEWRIQAQYFVREWIGIGAGYETEDTDLNSTNAFINGQRVLTPLFSTSSIRKVFFAYIPVRKSLGPVDVIGRVGGAFGSVEQRIFGSFVFHQDPDNPGTATNRNVESPTDTFNEGMNTQFGRVGIEVPIWGITMRATSGLKRVEVSDIQTDWQYDLEVEVGIPF